MEQRVWFQAGFLVPELGLSFSFLFYFSVYFLNASFSLCLTTFKRIPSFHISFSIPFLLKGILLPSLWLFLDSIFSTYILTLPLARLWTLPLSCALSFHETYLTYPGPEWAHSDSCVWKTNYGESLLRPSITFLLLLKLGEGIKDDAKSSLEVSRTLIP